MIRQCFSIFRGIGPGRERAIRAAGIATWEQLLAARNVPGLSDAAGRSLRRQIRTWSAALERQEPGDQKSDCAVEEDIQHEGKSDQQAVVGGLSGESVGVRPFGEGLQGLSRT